jgi:hypothetical protein
MKRGALLVVLLSWVLAWAQVTIPQSTESARPVGASEQTVELKAVQDTTLIESATGALSNGAGPAIFVGRTQQPRDSRRRALLAFDIAAARADGRIPAGAQVVAVKLTLTVVHTHAGDEPIALYRVLTAWGEGESKTPGGRGAPAMPGDATWLHTFFPDQRWSQPGGDYAATPSAVVTAGDVYTWGLTAQVVADVQSWLLAGPEHNFGWLLLGNEAVEGTVKSFVSREGEEPAQESEGKKPLQGPRLRVTFRPEGG